MVVISRRMLKSSESYQYENINNVALIKKMLSTIIYISFFLVLIFFPSVENAIGGVVSILSMWLFFVKVFTIERMRSYPIVFVVFLQLFCFMYLPMPMTLLDGHPISYMMHNPIRTFCFQFLYYCIALAALLLGCKLSKRHNGINEFLNQVGFFDSPSNKTLWILAIIGWIPKAVILQNQYSAGSDIYQAGFGTLNMFAIFIYAPILILFKELFGDEPCTSNTKKIIYAYIVFLAVGLIATNSRSQMIAPVILVLFCYMFICIYKRVNTYFFTPKRVVIMIIATLLLTGPISDIGIAMVIARADRSDLSFSELFNHTIDIYLDKEQLYEYRAISNVIENETMDSQHDLSWDETYVSNIFFNRFCNYHVADASINLAEKAGYCNPKMVDDFNTRLKILLPQFLVNFFFENIDKSKTVYSPQDLLYALGYSGSISRSYRVGGDVGLGLATFGYFYFVVLFVVYTLMFLLLANLVSFVNAKPIFSIYVLLNIYLTYFMLLTQGRGLGGRISYVIFSFWYSTIFLLLTTKIAKIMSSLVMIKK